jgi:hypothetical protein
VIKVRKASRVKKEIKVILVKREILEILVSLVKVHHYV